MEIKQKIDISWESIIRVLVVFLGSYVVYLIKDILVWVVFAFIISILFEPTISLLIKKKTSRFIATIIIYTVFIVLIGLFVYWIVPIFALELQRFSRLFPGYFKELSPSLQSAGIEAFKSMEALTSSLKNWLTGASSNILNTVISIFGGILSTVTILTLSIFFSIEKDEIEEIIKLIIPKKQERYFLELGKKLQRTIISWFSLRVLSGFFIAISSILTFYLLDMKHALALGLFAGVADFIPIIGPIFTSVIIVIFAFLDSWAKALLAVFIFTLIQQVESNIIEPILNKNLTGFPAVLMLIALLIGGKLWGVLGAILIVPLVGVAYGILKESLIKRKNA